MAKATGARTAVSDYRQLLAIAEIEAVYVSATPETTHYPMARDCLAAGKHVFLEKPIALELAEADELIALARETSSSSPSATRSASTPSSPTSGSPSATAPSAGR